MLSELISYCHRDAMLICPCKAIPEETAYTHIAQFSKMAPYQQQQAVWVKAANLMEASLDMDKEKSKPFWLSTSGLGIYWVHIRIDTWPKYYNWIDYKIRPRR